jgi:hypothetical protein
MGIAWNDRLSGKGSGLIFTRGIGVVYSTDTSKLIEQSNQKLKTPMLFICYLKDPKNPGEEQVAVVRMPPGSKQIEALAACSKIYALEPSFKAAADPLKPKFYTFTVPDTPDFGRYLSRTCLDPRNQIGLSAPEVRDIIDEVNRQIESGAPEHSKATTRS